EFNLSGKNGEVNAKGHLEGDQIFVVQAGSVTGGNWLQDDRFLKWGVIERRNGGYVFLQDYPFTSPTAASDYLLGDRNSRGWDLWTTSSGQSLRELTALAGEDELPR